MAWTPGKQSFSRHNSPRFRHKPLQNISTSRAEQRTTRLAQHLTAKLEMEQSAPFPQCPGILGGGETQFARSVQFIQEVQGRFQPSRPELYQRFLQAFKDVFGPTGQLQSQSAVEIAAGVHEKMKEVFKDDPDLLEKFTAFLPKDDAATEPDKDDITADEVD
ncbi:hypothetical protein B0H67DRAFT_594072 [Lasiosphaeris hirsuta]|uniref:Uncharacterized protein n=1 Tax=Lasiosphaeris hirsuta TaxID=260670 RepID=A0AA40DLQ8_9PEZI|nr:hypothetical protein B0H67DRAFT_594072 [Lasiosphaeris hirsuta]